jgi:Ca2+-transporting ATPase
VSLTGNPFPLYALVAAVFAKIALIYVPGLQWLFRTEALSLLDGVRVPPVSSSVLIVVEMDKYLRRRFQTSALPARH